MPKLKDSVTLYSRKAARSAICTTESGILLIAAVHNRVGADGPSLTEIAKVMQQLGCVDALNLDGGSSTSLYLGDNCLIAHPVLLLVFTMVWVFSFNLVLNKLLCI